MKMTFRWYGEGNDKITLDQIKQIPGVEGVVWSLHDMPAGALWSPERIAEVEKQAKEFGFNIDVVESVNVHEDIKLGLDTRDQYIENYKQTLRVLAKFGVKVVCYNFMPVFDWTRTNLYKKLPDGSNALFFEKSKINEIDPIELIETISKNTDVTMPGWEPERLANLKIPLSNMKVLLPRIYGRTYNTSLNKLFLWRKSATLKWRSIQTIQPSQSLACHALSLIRKILAVS